MNALEPSAVAIPVMTRAEYAAFCIRFCCAQSRDPVPLLEACLASGVLAWPDIAQALFTWSTDAYVQFLCRRAVCG